MGRLGCSRSGSDGEARGGANCARAGRGTMARAALLLCLLLCALPGHAQSPAPADAWLELRVDGASVTGDWKVPVTWLDAELHLDSDNDGEVTWREMEPRTEQIELALRSRLIVRSHDVDISLKITGLAYGTQHDEALILASLRGRESDRSRGGTREVVEQLEVDPALHFSPSSEDRTHVEVTWLGTGRSDGTMAAKSGPVTLTRDSASGSSFLDLLQAGIRHIWIGYDHILFLLVLLIPAVFERTAEGRGPVPDFEARSRASRSSSRHLRWRTRSRSPAQRCGGSSCPAGSSNPASRRRSSSRRC